MEGQKEKLNAEAEKALQEVIRCLGNKKEERQEQLKMTQFLRRFLEYADTPNHVTLVEAGTGIGKSFAYLTAVCEYLSCHRSERIVLATNTLTLMDQLLYKDIPVLQKLYPNLVFMAAKGQHNYLCLYKFYQLADQILKQTSDEQKKNLEEALENSTGERSALPEILESVWERIRCENRECFGQDCIYSGKCYLNRNRWGLKDAQVIVTNHALVLIDLLQQPVFPEYHYILFDEAHNLEQNIIQSLTTVITMQRVLDISQLADSQPCQDAFLWARKTQDFFQWKQTLRYLTSHFFERLNSSPNGGNLDIQVYNDGLDLLRHMESFESEFTHVQEQMAETGNSFEGTGVNNLYFDLWQVHDDLKVWLEHSLDQAVYWHEKDRCIYAPIDLSRQMQAVWEEKNTTLVSATLTVGNSFDHIRKQLGLPESTTYTLKLHSPFCYKKNALIYQPASAPSPKRDLEVFNEYVADTAEQLLRITKGRTFILFTSHKMLKDVFERLSWRLEDLPLEWMIQGEGQKEKLLEKYRNSEHPVLMGTDSYWEGVDEEIDCLIIAKLPFPVPNTPLEQARSELLLSQNRDPFQVLSLPKCALKLKQGVGRLIRRKDKRGVIVMCDPRILQSSWGKVLRNSLPEIPWTNRFQQCKEFLENL